MVITGSFLLLKLDNTRPNTFNIPKNMKVTNLKILSTIILFELVALFIYSCVTKDAATGRMKNDQFEEAASQFTSAMAGGKIDGFVSFYSDSVLYRDQVYGSSDRFTQKNLRKMFEPLFNSDTGWRIKIVTQAIDIKNETLMLKLNVTDPLKVVWEYAGWYRFQNGRIVEQLDFSMYPIKDLLESPRFIEYFKENRLKVVPIDSL
jgi:hypothetical protein